MTRTRPGGGVAVLALTLAAMAAPSPAAAQTPTPGDPVAPPPTASTGTSVKDYVTGLAGYTYDAKWSVADQVPEASDASKSFQMIGIPDGLGARPIMGGAELFMNHEVTNVALTQPVLGGPLNRGSFVSRLIQDAGANVVAGERAYDSVFVENTYVGPAAEADNPLTAAIEGNTTKAFGRFCSGGLWGSEVGFDQPIYLTGEESGGAGTFDGKGGVEVAIFDNEVHALPDMLHFAWENVIVLPGTGSATVVIGLEDGPSGPNSQMYMWIGQKDPSAGNVLARNGLLEGDNYVLKAEDFVSEADFTGGMETFKWVKLDDAAKNDTEGQLEARVDALGAFGFVRIEDGTPSKTKLGEAFFDTTGGAAGVNRLGRLYRMQMSATRPATGPVRLTILQNADAIVAAGGDTALSPDNLDINAQGVLMVQEDGTGDTRPVMASKGRDGSIWSFQTAGPKLSPTRVAELDPPGRDGTAVGPGIWETSGIIDASSILGPNTWILDVQAHGPTKAPAPFTVEDGQLGVLRPAS